MSCRSLNVYLKEVATLKEDRDHLSVIEIESLNARKLRKLQSLLLSNPGSVFIVYPSFIETVGSQEDLGEPMYEVSLTPREKDVLEMIANGGNNKVIARKLGITDGTVKVHVKNLMRKLNLCSRLQLAAWTYKEGFENILTLGVE